MLTTRAELSYWMLGNLTILLLYMSNNDDGSYYTKLGGQGKGPGEYGHVFGLEAKASKIFVLDFTSQRLNEYSTKDYSLVRTIPLEQWKSGGESGYVEARNDILLNQYAQ